MRKNKGFTLIELLGVIVILAVILVIAVPKILDVIERVDKNAYKESVELMAHTAQLQYSTNEIFNNVEKIPNGGIVYTFKDGIQYVTEGYDLLKFKGDTPDSGYITLTKDKKIIVEKLVSKNKKWCASKTISESKVQIDKCDLREINLNVSTTNTTKSIMVTVSPDDLETYYYKINDSEFESSTLNTKEYTELEKNKTYTITVRGCRKKEIVCEEKSVTVSLPDLDIPAYSISSIPEDQEATNGWATSRTVTIDYNQEKVEGTDYTTLINQYIYASTQEELIEKIDNNNWNTCETDSCTLPEFISETHIIARTTDGYNELSNSIITITNFDRENPSAPVITGGSEDWVNTNRTINVSTKSIAASEIKKYQYYVSISSTELTGGSWKDCTTSNLSQKFTDAGIYYIFFRSQSYVGKYSEASNVQVVKIDKTAPTCGSWTGQSNSWTNSNRTISVECTDGQSGCTKDSYAVKTYSSGTTTTQSLSYTISDNVGNTKTCSETVSVYVDKTAPSCSSSGGSTAWTNSGRTLIGTCSDTGGSGCKGNVSWLINWSGNWSNLSPGVVYDNAGNSTQCPANQTVRVDTTAPTCGSSGGSSSWTNGNRTLVGTCTDSESGCTGNVSKTISTNTNSSISPGTVYDNAGNSTICSVQTVKIDKTAPSLTYSSKSSSPNAMVINFIKSDSESGIKSTTCTYGKGNYNSIGSVSENACTMQSLDSGYTYNYKVMVTDNAGNSSNFTGTFIADGWYTSNPGNPYGPWYYYKNGSKVTGKVNSIPYTNKNTSDYYFNSSGVMQFNWLQINGSWYYAVDTANTFFESTNTQNNNKKIPNGSLVKNMWVCIPDDNSHSGNSSYYYWYHFNSSGIYDQKGGSCWSGTVCLDNAC